MKVFFDPILGKLRRNDLKEAIAYFNSMGIYALIEVANYSALPDPTTVHHHMYVALASQGTSWLPGSWGGNYYPEGYYYSDGTQWIYAKTPYQALQVTVDAGLVDNQFVSPLTFNNAAKWNTKVSSVTGANVDNTDPLNPIVEPLGLIQIIDKQGDFFTDLATASAYIRTMWVAPPTITNESFDSGVYYFTVPSNTIIEGFFLTDAVGGLPNNASVIDPLGLLTEFQSGACFVLNTGNHILGNCSFADTDFYQFSGNVFIKNIVDIFTGLGNSFAEFSSGKFIIEGNIGPLETAQYTPFFRNSTSTIFVNAGKYTSNSGAIHGDLQNAITNGCNVQFDGIDLEKVSNKSTSIVTDQASNIKYPSVKSVYDWVTTNYQPPKFSYTDTVLGTATSGAGNQFSKSVLIPANTLTSGALNIKGRATKSGSSSYGWLNIYINTANNLSGATHLGQINSSGGNTLVNFAIDRTIPIQAGSFVTFIVNTTNGFEEIVTNQVSTTTIDWTVDQYVILSCQSNGGADPMRANFLSVNQF